MDHKCQPGSRLLDIANSVKTVRVETLLTFQQKRCFVYA
jgi:hypothetical protein